MWNPAHLPAQGLLGGGLQSLLLHSGRSISNQLYSLFSGSISIYLLRTFLPQRGHILNTFHGWQGHIFLCYITHTQKNNEGQPPWGWNRSMEVHSSHSSWDLSVYLIVWAKLCQSPHVSSGSTALLPPLHWLDGGCWQFAPSPLKWLASSSSPAVVSPSSVTNHAGLCGSGGGGTAGALEMIRSLTGSLLCTVSCSASRILNCLNLWIIGEKRLPGYEKRNISMLILYCGLWRLRNALLDIVYWFEQVAFELCNKKFNPNLEFE